jgi:hypothetical protein
MIRLCFSAARDLAFLRAAPEQGEKSTAMRIVGLLGVGVLRKAILGPPFSQSNSIRIFIIIDIQQFIGKRLQNPKKALDSFRVISNNFDCFPSLNFPERLCDPQKSHRDYHTPQIENVVDCSFQ